MALNLEQHRAEHTVWHEPRAGVERDADRWLAASLAGGSTYAGIRRRSWTGVLLLLTGASLACWAATGIDARRMRRGQVLAALQTQPGGDDPVTTAARESFPASDPPPWTPTTGSLNPS